MGKTHPLDCHSEIRRVWTDSRQDSALIYRQKRIGIFRNVLILGPPRVVQRRHILIGKLHNTMRENVNKI